MITAVRLHSIDARFVPAVSRPALVGAGRGASLVSVGNTSSVIVLGPVRFVRAFVAELVRQDEAGSIDREAWEELGRALSAPK